MRKQAIQKPIQLKELAAIRNRSCIPSVIEYIDSKTQVTVSCIKIQERSLLKYKQILRTFENKNMQSIIQWHRIICNYASCL